jgi:nucleotide-binding universal stress UspA family protein
MEESTMNTPVLVATDGSRGSLGALRLARGLAEAEGRPVIALGVVEPFTPVAVAPHQVLVPASGAEAAQLSMLRGIIEEQVRAVAGTSDDWSIETEVGHAATTIVRRAAEHQAGLILTGLGRHDVADRWLGTETALKVSHIAHTPVLAVHPEASRLPRRVLAATDFSEYSRDAARAAVELAPECAEVHLAHVVWSLPTGRDAQTEIEWLETYRAGARTRLAELRSSLGAERKTRLLTTLLEGETARALIKYANMIGAEMIATGSHGYGFFGRMMMGSVSTRLLRQAGCSVLVAPPRMVAVKTLSRTAPSSREEAEPASVV